MSLLLVLLALAVGLHQCVGNEKNDKAFAALSTDLLTVQEEIVDRHNDLRRQVDPSGSNILKMMWNETAASNAKSWADECIYEHSPESRRTIEGDMICGENLYYATVPQPWRVAFQSWFDEHHEFIYGVGPKSEDADIGHYTQLVWATSPILGCASAKCPDEMYPYFYVCQYCPAGNIIGESYYKPYNEGEPCGECMNSCDKGLCTNFCPHDDKYKNCKALKQNYTCSHPEVGNFCPASCHCTDKIY